ncbi:MAG TPA: hypothetical protein VEC57_20915 [Candidatus Limnocylindrales bacterium]|nr:hypothetical protein [Candidatus Limnocylindrales bacterium]
MPLPPDIIDAIRAHIDAQRELEVHVLAAKRLLDAGDTKGAKRELAEAEKMLEVQRGIERLFRK